MAIGFARPKPSILKQRRKKSHKTPSTPSIQTNRLVNADSLPPDLRRSHLLAGGPVMSIAIPGGMTLLLKKDDSSADGDNEALDDMDLDIDVQEPYSERFPIRRHGSPLPEEKKAKKREQAHNTRQRLAARWKEEVLPRILPHYLRFHIYRPFGGKSFDESIIDLPCQCTSVVIMRITVVHWNALRETNLTVCQCRPAPDQLIRRGLFPCSPIQPSLAVEIQLLELISASFIHLTLNATGWAQLLEQFLRWSGYSLKFENSLRQRLNSCILYYQQLKQLADIQLRRYISGVTQPTLDNQQPARERSPSPMNFQKLYSLPHSSADSLLADTVRQVSDSKKTNQPVASSKQENTRDANTSPTGAHPDTNAANANANVDSANCPSPLLCDRCPVCFGGPKPNLRSSRADVIVCLDANFSQKRRRSRYMDLPFITNSSFFISSDSVRLMEAEVTSAHTKKPRTLPESIKVANEILDDCEKSFTAAQESRSKTSKNFFDDTGLMALICRHDHILFMANLQSTGEKQYYALALLATLFKELPSSWTVGVLYDIGCQLHRSCEKFDLLPLYRHRILWGISVFHAYGHQWPCQLVYHPRKREDFGFSDGEGCERLWSAISNLVAPLRGSNHHRRLFALDLSMQHFSQEGLKNLGRWFLRKYKMLLDRKNAAQIVLDRNINGIKTLREQWHLQIEAQTKATPRHSQKAAERQIAALLLLRRDLKQAIIQQDALLAKPASDDREKDIGEALAAVAEIQAKIQRAEALVGTGAASMTLRQASKDPFLAARLAAHATKERLVRRIRARKFEESKLERHMGRPALGNKLYTHTKSSINRRDPGIKSLAAAFNAQIDTMQELKDAKPKYEAEKLPEKINPTRLFHLDIFSEVWNDTGLLSQEDSERWRFDSSIQEGIQVLLELDRCSEEEERLDVEISRLATWAKDKATRLRNTFESLDSKDVGLYHQFCGYVSTFRYLLDKWNLSLARMNPIPTFKASLELLDVVPLSSLYVVGAPQMTTPNSPLNNYEDEFVGSDSSDSDTPEKIEMDLFALDSDSDSNVLDF